MKTNDLPAAVLPQAHIQAYVEAACNRIAPLWPLKHFVAVNPFFGFSDMTFQQASDTLARITCRSLYMPRAYYREQYRSGRITPEDVVQAIRRCGSTLSLQAVEAALATEGPQPKMGMVSVSDILALVEGGLWSSFVTERISLHCAAYFDLGQASIALPWKHLSLYAAWREAAQVDRSPALMGLRDFGAQVARLPEQAQPTIEWAVGELGVPPEALERYLHAALLSVGGWAAWTRYLRWQAQLQGRRDDAIVDLLAIRLAWDALLFRAKRSPALEARWREMLAHSMREPSAKRQAAAEIDRIWLAAMEIGFQRQVAAGLAQCRRRQHDPDPVPMRPAAQAVFCIDVRSEVYRRSLETVAPQVQTAGFAGFFGVFIEWLPLGADEAQRHIPVIFNPTHRIAEVSADGQPLAAAWRRRRLAHARALKNFKFGAASCFSFVETQGLLYAGKLLAHSLGWSRPVPYPQREGLDGRERLKPAIEPPREPALPDGRPIGIDASARVADAARILKAMSLPQPLARIVLLVGHGSSSVNNPHATGLDCGACGGQTGEASARVAAALFNDPVVRSGLAEQGMPIPSDTWFVPALHDTTTDEVTLLDTDDCPAHLRDELAQLRRWLEQASDLTRMQRAALLGLGGWPDQKVAAQIRARSRDWSQVRPEWGLANNAAFIAAPRSRTQGLDLGGRAFLHEYVWKRDPSFEILTLIMTAPMVVANWINMQYYASVVDNARWGSGNKVLHNIVGGAIGVLEGNGGDLRVGLPLQSLHDGQRWVHEPLRLSVYIEAPRQAMEDVLARHALVRQLVDHQWLHLFQIDDEGRVWRRASAHCWGND
ncbi:hypothetical protein Talka_00790 [Tepidimonas alkaliphilus]|uniref:Probable inorganic carbon transporter subunit DabA n=1 Tax=Tepidimonas alkaliphilus TaxID=2588942 RepID=A0A554WA49_9BURK|nr:DUF2309 domain-containing protein [Tepidimonas alkaliphilus]TSE20444.1 hypothetical protein Talka_00790 [Tepidimonas alkaliphilus]